MSLFAFSFCTIPMKMALIIGHIAVAQALYV